MRRVIAVSAVCLAVLGLSTTALAKPMTDTVVRKNVVESFSEVDPCLGPITINLVYNDVFHITEQVSGPNTGTIHVTFTQAGSFFIETEDPSLSDFSGHFAVWGGFNGNRQNASETFTFNAVGKAPDGTRIRFHAIAHVNVSASGIENSFLFESIDCPVG
jgi:hypothetical protein